MLGASTRNTLICIPTALETLKDDLKVKGEPCDLFIPIGFATIRFGPILYFVIATLFMGMLMGRTFSMTDLGLVAAFSVAASFATLGVTGLAALAPLAVVLRPFGLSGRSSAHDHHRPDREYNSCHAECRDQLHDPNSRGRENYCARDLTAIDGADDNQRHVSRRSQGWAPRHRTREKVISSQRPLLMVTFFALKLDPRLSLRGRDAIGRAAFGAFGFDPRLALFDDNGFPLHRLFYKTFGFSAHFLF